MNLWQLLQGKTLKGNLGVSAGQPQEQCFQERPGNVTGPAGAAIWKGATKSEVSLLNFSALIAHVRSLYVLGSSPQAHGFIHLSPSESFLITWLLKSALPLGVPFSTVAFDKQLTLWLVFPRQPFQISRFSGGTSWEYHKPLRNQSSFCTLAGRQYLELWVIRGFQWVPPLPALHLSELKVFS